MIKKMIFVCSGISFLLSLSINAIIPNATCYQINTRLSTEFCVDFECWRLNADETRRDKIRKRADVRGHLKKGETVITYYDNHSNFILLEVVKMPLGKVHEYAEKNLDLSAISVRGASISYVTIGRRFYPKNNSRVLSLHDQNGKTLEQYWYYHGPINARKIKQRLQTLGFDVSHLKRIEDFDTISFWHGPDIYYF